MEDKNINQQDLETDSRQLNKKEELANTGDRRILSEMNTNADDNPEEMKNLETAESTAQSTRTQISTKPSEEVIWYDASHALLKKNPPTTKFSASQVPKLY